jgi:VanZ family protein
LALLIVSWTPQAYVVRSGMLSGHAEHLVAYCVSGGLTCAVLVNRFAAWQVAAIVVAYAGFLEFGQMFVPGRRAAIDDFSVSAAGVIAGICACVMLYRTLATSSLADSSLPPGKKGLAKQS